MYSLAHFPGLATFYTACYHSTLKWHFLFDMHNVQIYPPL